MLVLLELDIVKEISIFDVSLRDFLLSICYDHFLLFILGVILYTLLHGRQPFNRDSKSIVNDIVAGKYEVTLHI